MLTDPNTFVQVAADCPAGSGVAPELTRDPKPAHVLQHELLSAAAYRYTNDELLFEVHVRRMGMGEAEIAAQREALWQELFAKSHPCMRASPLPKKYGRGVHSDSQGRLALYGRDSEEYRRFVAAGERGELKLTAALRSRRA